MTYGLAAELKDAGFRPKGKGHEFFPMDGVLADHPYAPTLDELIQACGDKFLVLKLNIDVKALGRWEAGSYWRQRTLQAFGATPDEAVARLWLQLQSSSASKPIFS